MKPIFTMLLLAYLPLFGHCQEGDVKTVADPVYFGFDHFLLEGTAIADSQKESHYDRLPTSLKEEVREPVWNLSKSSAGLSVRFITNSTAIHLRWTLLNDNSMNHMADTGIKGLDLYVKQDDAWHYVNTARPTGKENEAVPVKNLSPEFREFRVFLPLYDGVVDLEVGIDDNARIRKPQPTAGKPIVFYGTSITQGGCASRPGMAHTNIISRGLGVDCINLGFSGNGRMEKPIVDLIAGFDAKFYVIECLPNMSPELVTENTLPLIEGIRAVKPDTPILLVENSPYSGLAYNDASAQLLAAKNEALDIEFKKAVEKGIPDLYLIKTKGALGEDEEGTVDAVHLTDLGFMRYADFLMEKIEELGLTN